MNLYCASLNSPIGYFDSLGLFSDSTDCTAERVAKLKEAERVGREALKKWIEFLGDNDKINVQTIGDKLGKNIGWSPTHQNYMAIIRFRDALRTATEQILKAMETNVYGVECECPNGGFCIDEGEDANYAYVNGTWKILGWDDDIHFCTLYWNEDDKEQAALFVHEVAHFVKRRPDNYEWNFPGPNLNDSLSHPQIFEKMAEFSDMDGIETRWWSWLNSTYSNMRTKVLLRKHQRK